MRVVIIVVCALMASAAPANAQSSVVREAVAEQLFDEGRAAMRAKNYELACEKLEQSQRTDPAGGTVLLLAMCLEARGLLASAWTRYREALGFARRDQRPDRAARAEQHISAIEPRLSRLYVRVDPAVPASASVSLDGMVLPRSAHDSGIPLDPGEHVLRVRAPGHVPWTKRFSVGNAAEHHRIAVPRLARPPARRKPRPDWQRDTGLALLGGGAASILASVIAAGVALHRDARADELCPEARCADRRAIDESAQARSAADVATVSLGVGLALGVAGGLVLWTSE